LAGIAYIGKERFSMIGLLKKTISDDSRNVDVVKNLISEIKRLPTNSWYKHNEFKAILKATRLLSERTGRPLSCIIVNLNQNFKNNEKISKKSYIDFLREMIKIIAQYTRESDIKHILSPNRLTILLIDTCVDDAKDLVERFSTQLFESLKLKKMEYHTTLIDSISIAVYPVNQLPEIEKIEGFPVVIKDISIKKSDPASTAETLHRMESCFHIDWNCEASPHGEITMAAPLFQDLIFGNRLPVNYFAIKRVLDVIGSIMFISASLPILIFISILVKLSSKGPVLFKQERLGYNGKPFIFYKFRSMKINATEKAHKEYVHKFINGDYKEVNGGDESEPFYKLTGDERITRVGKFLRISSLDELPQFLNVLKGDMSLIGPRPAIPYEIEAYKTWHFKRLLQIRPGITGYWQVSGRNRTTFDEMVKMDVYYAENVSFGLDIKILFKTVGEVLSFSAK